MNKELQKLWEILKKDYGIYTLEKLREEMKKTELDIGIFTMPIKRGEESRKEGR